MSILIWLLWWGLALAASYKALTAWGGGAGIASVAGLLVASWVLPWGTAVSAVFACAIGYQAEVAGDRKQLTG